MSRHLPRREPVGLLVAFVMLVSSCGGSQSSSGVDESPSSDLDQLPLVRSSLEVGEPAQFEQGTHCGFRILNTMINGQVWRAEGASNGDWFPNGWKPDSSTPDGLSIPPLGGHFV